VSNLTSARLSTPIAFILDASFDPTWSPFTPGMEFALIQAAQ
jgi:hypothetical protein